MNFRALEKSIRVLGKSWKFVSEKGYKPCSHTHRLRQPSVVAVPPLLAIPYPNKWVDVELFSLVQKEAWMKNRMYVILNCWKPRRKNMFFWRARFLKTLKTTLSGLWKCLKNGKAATQTEHLDRCQVGHFELNMTNFKIWVLHSKRWMVKVWICGWLNFIEEVCNCNGQRYLAWTL